MYVILKINDQLTTEDFRPLLELPLPKIDCLVQGHASSLRVAYIQKLVDIGILKTWLPCATQHSFAVPSQLQSPLWSKLVLLLGLPHNPASAAAQFCFITYPTCVNLELFLTSCMLIPSQRGLLGEVKQLGGWIPR